MIITKSYALNEDIINAQLSLLMDFAQSYAYYQAIHNEIERLQKNEEFWVHTMNTHFLKAIIDWCIVFGVDSNETHWKKSCKIFTNKIELELELRTKFYSAADFSKNEFESYWKKITDFRNEHVGHKSLNTQSDIIPNLNNALRIADCYFKWIKESLGISSHDLIDLNEYFFRCKNSVSAILATDLADK